MDTVGLLKACIKQACSALRINEALIRAQRPGLLVLNYHGVLREARPDRWGYGNCVDAESFRRQLRWLKRHFSPQGLEGLRLWQSGRFNGRKPPVVITFDDGYRNNLTVAAPICREEGFPAVFFLTTGMIGSGGILWNDEVVARVLHWPEAEITLPSGETRPLARDTSVRRAVAQRANQEAKQLPEETLRRYLAYLREATPSAELMDDPEARSFLTWDEARDLAGLGFEVGSHTVSHPILSRLSRERVRLELRDSKARLEQELERPCIGLAYPNGSTLDINEVVVEEARAAGYEWAFITTPVWCRRGVDAHRVPRIGFPGHTDMATFQFYASGLHSRLSGQT